LGKKGPQNPLVFWHKTIFKCITKGRRGGWGSTARKRWKRKKKKNISREERWEKGDKSVENGKESCRKKPTS